MAERFIPIYPGTTAPASTAAALDGRNLHSSPTIRPGATVVDPSALTDGLGRPLRDLRISVTDRCNFRCSYCMPRTVFGSDYAFLPQSQLLTFEEITRVAGAFVELGVRKIRLTGGEPLLRRDLESLVSQLSALRTPQGDPLDLTLTTNGSVLRKKAAALKAAGLRRLTVSLDALSDAVFRKMNDADYPVADVLDGIDAAMDAGFDTIKVNMVVKRGTNDSEVLPMAAYFRGRGIELRFIEYMDVGSHNQWRLDEVLPSAAVHAQIHEHFPLVHVPAHTPDETAERYAYADGQGFIGLISSVSQAFCRECSRARLSTDGRLFTCLFAHAGHDLRPLVRQPAADTDDGRLRDSIAAIWHARLDRYSELRGLAPGSAAVAKVEMHYIGG